MNHTMQMTSTSPVLSREGLQKEIKAVLQDQTDDGSTMSTDSLAMASISLDLQDKFMHMQLVSDSNAEDVMTQIMQNLSEKTNGEEKVEVNHLTNLLIDELSIMNLVKLQDNTSEDSELTFVNEN